MEFERDWSYEDALNAHEALDAVEIAQHEARELAQSQAARDANRRSAIAAARGGR